MTTTYLQYLFDRYYQQLATPEEVEELMAYIAQHPEAPGQLPDLLQQQWEALIMADPQYTAASGAPVLDKILVKRNTRIVRIPARYQWAAAVLVFIGLGATYLIMRHLTTAPAVVTQPVILPGSSKAVLTLADGSSIPLDSNGNKVLHQGNAVVSQQGGQLLYADAGQGATNSFNTLKTPRGGQFRLTLPDGTQVWLNAKSSITYPTAFTGNTRQVSVTGEVFFDVATMPSQPFRVKVNGETNIDVLGTQFNVNAYTDEADISTTLVEGKVKVAGQGENGSILHPGQQARTSAAHGTLIVNDANTDQAIAWKNGVFDFDGQDLPDIMRQLSRWYDIDVVFQGSVPQRRFGGEMQRGLQLRQVLAILEKMDVKFKIAGKQLIILPNETH